MIFTDFFCLKLLVFNNLGHSFHIVILPFLALLRQIQHDNNLKKKLQNDCPKTFHNKTAKNRNVTFFQLFLQLLPIQLSIVQQHHLRLRKNLSGFKLNCTKSLKQKNLYLLHHLIKLLLQGRIKYLLIQQQFQRVLFSLALC